jgi:hypothetical protein
LNLEEIASAFGWWGTNTYLIERKDALMSLDEASVRRDVLKEAVMFESQGGCSGRSMWIFLWPPAQVSLRDPFKRMSEQLERTSMN